LKTWIEYINRTFTGVVSIIAIGMLVTSFSWWGSDKVFAALGITVILLIGFEAWLGAVVVKTNLNNYKVTIHLAAAMFILAISLIAVVRTLKYGAISIPVSPAISVLMGLVLLALLVQVIIGTLVRTEMDYISQNMDGTHRELWMDYAKAWFPFHSKFSYVVSGLVAILAAIVFRKRDIDKNLKNAIWLLVLATLGQMLAGIAMAKFDFPATAQLIHLVLAMTMFGALVFALAWNLTKLKTNETASPQIGLAH